MFVFFMFFFAFHGPPDVLSLSYPMFNQIKTRHCFRTFKSASLKTARCLLESRPYFSFEPGAFELFQCALFILRTADPFRVSARMKRDEKTGLGLKNKINTWPFLLMIRNVVFLGNFLFVIFNLALL